MPVSIGTLKETAANETRVALVPEIAGKFAALGAQVLMERSAGLNSQAPDASYKNTEILDSPAQVLGRTDVLLKVQPPTLQEIDALRPGSTIIGFFQAHQRLEEMRRL